MKNTRQIFFLSMILLTFSGATAVFGQDAAFEYETIDSDRDRFERDRIIYSPGEGESRYIPSRSTIDPKNSHSTTPAKDSTSRAAAATPVLPAPVKIKQEPGPKAPAKPLPPKEDDDAIMSFNFLYYIIQKYKLQDIIE